MVHKKRHKKPLQKWILTLISTLCLASSFKIKRTIKSCSVRISQEWTTSATVVTWIQLSKCWTVYHKLKTSILIMDKDIHKHVNLYHQNVFIVKHQKYLLDWIMVNIHKKEHEQGLLMINKLLKNINLLSVLMTLNFWLLKIILNSDLIDNKMLKNIYNGCLIDWPRRNLNSQKK